MIDLIDEIAQVDEFMIEDILKAVLKRYAELFPDWEISTMSINKSHDRNAQLDRMISLLEKMKTDGGSGRMISAPTNHTVGADIIRP